MDDRCSNVNGSWRVLPVKRRISNFVAQNLPIFLIVFYGVPSDENTLGSVVELSNIQWIIIGP